MTDATGSQSLFAARGRFDWRKWGFGFSVEIADPAFLRLWIGPLRIGWKWGRNV